MACKLGGFERDGVEILDMLGLIEPLHAARRRSVSNLVVWGHRQAFRYQLRQPAWSIGDVRAYSLEVTSNSGRILAYYLVIVTSTRRNVVSPGGMIGFQWCKRHQLRS